ncbi:AAA family ATPase [Rhizosphaericola mali]|uniref:AAA family ATPase n=1 Tax=Rhizosphaericola mali TaxID=2545455 RepID=A0A5P2G378_9BACT|nr:AAA family ATPase [Rhizosphaericola mali]QES89657.1 AAA family ATPase [Rhizosphaericola mali]
MIKKININNLGLYQNFQWDVTVRDKGNNPAYFKKENIIYGRNYSGKTTLSRIIRALETKEISPKYINPEFQIVLDNNTIDQNNFRTNKLNVRCFNEDFIKENLRFIIDPDSEIKPFAILGENAEIEAQIEAIKGELGEKKEDLKTLKYKDLDDLITLVITKENEYSDLKRNLESQLTTKATGGTNSIKQQHAKFGDISYNITKLNRDIGIVLKGSFVPIDSSKEALNLQQIKEVQKTNVTKEIKFINVYTQVLAKITDLLNQSLLDGNKIAELLANSSLNEWVKKGYELHTENRNCDCKFCGNPIKTSRWEQLDDHFDDETKKLGDSLLSYKRQLETEIANVESYRLPSSDFFYISFHEELAACSLNFNVHITNYKTDLEFLVSKINERLSAIHTPVTVEDSISFSEESLTDVITSYNELRDKNNAYSNELIDKIKEAKEELRLLEVKRFVDTIQYSALQTNITAKESDYNTKKQERDDLVVFIKQKEKEIEDLSRQLNNEEEGARRVNEYLRNYFGHQNLELQAIEEEIDSYKKIRFNIVRNRNLAYHLSEGECSIISFCYFMAKLDDIHTAGQKPIIFIDDPISSLDSNHIFYIYSLINSELFIKERFQQIFLSTHNLDFLKYLKRLKFSKNQYEYFIINRYSDYSELALMPNYLKNYVTEFNFLFEQIYKCAKAEIINDDNHSLFYNFGNNARKFLEALLFYKYPSKIDNQTQNANSKRLLKYFGNDQQAATLTDRVNNELSHLEEIFDRGMSPIDIPELKRVAQFILDKIKDKDEEQYNALLQSIGKEEPVIQNSVVSSLN